MYQGRPPRKPLKRCSLRWFFSPRRGRVVFQSKQPGAVYHHARKGVQDFNEPNSVCAAQSVQPSLCRSACATSPNIETVVPQVFVTNPCSCISLFIKSKDGAIVFLSMLFMLVLYLVVSLACFLNFKEALVLVTQLPASPFFSGFLEVHDFAIRYTGRL